MVFGKLVYIVSAANILSKTLASEGLRDQNKVSNYDIFEETLKSWGEQYDFEPH